MTQTFTAIIREENGSYIAECPEARATGQGSTPEEALLELKEVADVTSFASQSFADQLELEQARRRLREKPKKGTSEWDLYGGGEVWIDSEAFSMLEQSSNSGDMSVWNEWYCNHSEERIYLEGADFDFGPFLHTPTDHGYRSMIYLKAADLRKVYLVNAKLHCLDLESSNLKHAELQDSDFTFSVLDKVNLEFANLENTRFRAASLKGTDLGGTKLQNANFSVAIVNEETFMEECEIDDKTNFTGVALDAARVEPRLLAALKTNIRRIAWKEWYAECKTKRKPKQETSRPGLLSKIMPPLLDNGLIFLVLPLLSLFALPMWGIVVLWQCIMQYGLTASFIKLFWWISDYGSSTKRVLKVFFGTALSFAVLYAVIDWHYPGILKDIAPEAVYKAMQNNPLTPYTHPQAHAFVWALQIAAFSLATMVTLGFGGINVRFVEAFPTASGAAIILVVLNLLCGYFLLAVLVTRIGILFQSPGPEQEVSKPFSSIGAD